MLTEMYCSHQYLSIGPNKSLPRPKAAHILQKIVYINADIADLGNCQR